MEPSSSQQYKPFDFGGLLWHRRVTNQVQGPGNNLFGIKLKNVYLDKKGHLNLKIKKAGKKYSCAEVYTDEFIGEGRIETIVQTSLKHFAEDMVLGIFFYDGTAPPYYNEVDIEYALWGNKENLNGQYAIHSKNGIETHRFELPKNKLLVKHVFDISHNHISIRSFVYKSELNEYILITERTFTRPQEFTFEKTHFRFNLWLTKEKTSKKAIYPKVKIISFNFTSSTKK